MTYQQHGTSKNMSEWITRTKEDMFVDEDDLCIHVESDDFGARYVQVKIKDAKEILKSICKKKPKKQKME